MQLLPLDSPERIRLAASWLTQRENYQWLDFGDGRQLVSAEWLKVAMQRGSYVLRIFTADDDETPIGVVGLSNINPHFNTASIWVVLGEKRHSGRGYATRATCAMLTLGFGQLGIGAIHTWIVEHNPSIHVAKHLGFRPIGRQRRCHYIDGHAYDRLWFDLLPTEHEEALDVECRRTA